MAKTEKILFDMADFVRKESNQQALILPKQIKVKSWTPINILAGKIYYDNDSGESDFHEERYGDDKDPFITSDRFFTVWGVWKGKYLIGVVRADCNNWNDTLGISGVVLCLVDPKDVIQIGGYSVTFIYQAFAMFSPLERRNTWQQV